MQPDTYTKSRTRELVRRCVESIAEHWPKGKPVDGDVAERFDAAIIKAMNRGDTPAVQTYCARYRNWCIRR